MCVAYLVRSAFCKSLILFMAIGKGIFASWERKRSSAWISSLVVIARVVSKIVDWVTCRDGLISARLW